MAAPPSPEIFLAVAFRLERENAGFTQEGLALEIGVKPSEISHLESGRRNPKYRTMKRVADGLDVSCEHLVRLAERLESAVIATRVKR